MILFLFIKNRLYVKKILKYENNNKREKINICILLLRIVESSLVGKNPPEEIIVKAKFNELKLRIDIKFKIIKINKVKPEYRRKIFVDCLNISELLNEIKLVNDFLKLSS